MTKHLYKIILSSSLIIAIGCNKTPEAKTESSAPQAQQSAATQTAPPKSGRGVGIVKEISKDRKFITLDHNDIPKIMDAMTMEYPVQSPELLRDINSHDSVSFTLTKTPESQYMVTEIHKK